MMATPGPQSLEPDDEVFADGNMTPVVRRGETVVRRSAPWSRASHAVLLHLERVGFNGAPRLIGVHGGEETLSFVPGASAPADLTDLLDDEVLVAVGKRIRDLHRALAGFVADPSITFPAMPGTPVASAEALVVCHNHLAPWNTIFDGRHPAAFIDWDLVAPAPSLWDLAYAAWRFVPLYPDESLYGDAAWRGRRIRLLLDAYGVPHDARHDIVELIRKRQVSAYDAVEQWGRNGIAGFGRLFEAGLHLGALDDIAWLDRHAAVLRAALDR